MIYEGKVPTVVDVQELVPVGDKCVVVQNVGGSQLWGNRNSRRPVDKCKPRSVAMVDIKCNVLAYLTDVCAICNCASIAFVFISSTTFLSAVTQLETSVNKISCFTADSGWNMTVCAWKVP